MHIQHGALYESAGIPEKKQGSGAHEQQKEVVVRSATEWIQSTEPIAYGPLKLKPIEYEKLQVHEFNKMLEGYMLRQRSDDRRNSYFTACIMQCMAANTIQPDDIYHGLHPEDRPDPVDDREEFLAANGLPSMKKEDR